MIRKILAVMLFCTQLCYAQTKEISIPTYSNGKTTLWYKWQQENFKKVGLLDLTESKEELHFRFSTETQSIDIWTTNFKTFNGTFANFTKHYNSASNEKPEKFHSEKKDIDTATSRLIYNIFEKLSIFTIPSDDKIEGWDSGNDGDEYIIEFATPAKYSFKTYWTPSSYKYTIKEAAAINDLSDKLEVLLKMKKSFLAFIKSLPKGSYHAGGMMVIVNTKEKPKN